MAIQEISLGVVANNGEGDPLREGGEKINQNFTDTSNAASYEVGTEAGQIPRNDDLGSASTKDTGTEAGQVPTNGDLGSASTKDTGTDTGQIPTADQLNMVGETNYTSGNVNLNVFEGNAVNDYIAVGWAISSTTAVFPLPISSNSVPVSATVEGTLRIVKTNNANVSTGISSALLDSTSSKKIANLVFSGLSGMTAGESLSLRIDTASSKVTIVF